jgi:hypothetical protein
MAHYYVGLDVHQATNAAAVLNGNGKVILDSTMETRAPTLRHFIAMTSCSACEAVSLAALLQESPLSNYSPLVHPSLLGNHPLEAE